MSTPGGNKRAYTAAPVTATIANGAALSDAINMRGYAFGHIYLPAAWTAADIGAYICDTEDGTYVPLYDVYGALGDKVSIDGPAASRAYQMPTGWFGAHYLKLWSHNGSGTDANQAAERIIRYSLES